MRDFVPVRKLVGEELPLPQERKVIVKLWGGGGLNYKHHWLLLLIGSTRGAMFDGTT